MGDYESTNGCQIRRGAVYGTWMVYRGYRWVGAAMTRGEARKIAREFGGFDD